VKRIAATLSTVFVAGCGPSRPAPATGPGDPPATDPDQDPGALARAEVLTGDWIAADGGAPVTWLRPGGPRSAIYGVAAAGTPIVWVVDDEPVTAPPAERSLRLWRYQGEDPPRVCDENPEEIDGLVWSCEEGAGGAKFWRNGSVLDVEEWTASTGPDQVHLVPRDPAAAPALEEADRQFDLDTAARGVAGWMAWFAEDAVIWRDVTEMRGKPAIEAAMTRALAAIELRWTPTVSRMLVPDSLGVTAGTSVITARVSGERSTGTYVTVWRKDPDGWRIVIDLGRDDG
jgi:ketosteroid isomerase-like protein